MACLCSGCFHVACLCIGSVSAGDSVLALGSVSQVFSSMFLLSALTKVL